MPHPKLFSLALVAICLVGVGPAMAQSNLPDTTGAAKTGTSASGGRADRLIERIRIEDAGSRIDELRVGGETQSITVSPKGGMPAYEVIPSSANRSPATVDRNNTAGSGGTRVWKILGF